MFLNSSHSSHAYISKSKMCFNVRSWSYYFRMRAKRLADFQIFISVAIATNYNFYSFFINEKFLKCLKPLWKHIFSDTCKWFYKLFSASANKNTDQVFSKHKINKRFRKSLKTTSNSKHNRQKTQNTDRQKTSFFKWLVRKCRFIKIRIKQDNKKYNWNKIKTTNQ